MIATAMHTTHTARNVFYSVHHHIPPSTHERFRVILLVLSKGVGRTRGDRPSSTAKLREGGRIRRGEGWREEYIGMGGERARGKEGSGKREGKQKANSYLTYPTLQRITD